MANTSSARWASAPPTAISPSSRSATRTDSAISSCRCSCRGRQWCAHQRLSRDRFYNGSRNIRLAFFRPFRPILRALAQLEGATKPPSLRLVISAGAPLSADVAQQFHRRYGIKIHNFYGSSETGGICYDRTGNATLSGRSVGKPMDDVVVRIRRDGRVSVSSRAGNATLPDLGEWNRYGELRLLGRVGEVANIGGKKVSPAELERALRELRGVSDAWVSVVQDKRGNDYLAAAVETTRVRIDLEEDLLRALPSWKLPRKWLIGAVLPRNDRGKLHTAELRARLSVSLP